MRIFLVGMPGSGKSTLGKRLALQLQLPFYDLDKEIVEREKISINEIFEKFGENHFRYLEHEILKKLVKEEKKFVIATGGGTPCFFNNMDFMCQNGDTVFLNISPEEISKRLLKEGIRERPLLKELSKNEIVPELKQKLTARLQFYQKASLTITEAHETDHIITTLKERNPS